jgi:hypothetical protein
MPVGGHRQVQLREDREDTDGSSWCGRRCGNRTSTGAAVAVGCLVLATAASTVVTGRMPRQRSGDD